jgi:hypothetical protein
MSLLNLSGQRTEAVHTGATACPGTHTDGPRPPLILPYHTTCLLPRRSLAQAAPSFNWVLAYCGEARRTLTQFTPRELATLAWTLHRWAQLLMAAWTDCL